MRAPSTSSLLEFRNWQVEIGPGARLPVRDWLLAPGQCIALRGGSGSGKSLLLRSFMGLEPARGRRFHGGQEVISLRSFRTKVQFIPQVPTFEPRMSAAEAIGARTSAQQARAASELECLGVADPTALLARTVDVASGGERARLALVRALLMEPVVIVLDEPTAALDPENERRFEMRLQEWLGEKPTQRAVIFTSHSQAQRVRLASEEWEVSLLP